MLFRSYSVSSPLVAMHHQFEEADFIVTSSIRKALVFNSSAVPIKTTRTTQGVQVLLSKKGSQMITFKRLSESGITEPQYYRNKTLPAVGSYIRENTLNNRQLGLDVT